MTFKACFECGKEFSLANHEGRVKSYDHHLNIGHVVEKRSVREVKG